MLLHSPVVRVFLWTWQDRKEQLHFFRRLVAQAVSQAILHPSWIYASVAASFLTRETLSDNFWLALSSSRFAEECLDLSNSWKFQTEAAMARIDFEARRYRSSSPDTTRQGSVSLDCGSCRHR